MATAANIPKMNLMGVKNSTGRMVRGTEPTTPHANYAQLRLLEMPVNVCDNTAGQVTPANGTAVKINSPLLSEQHDNNSNAARERLAEPRNSSIVFNNTTNFINAKGEVDVQSIMMSTRVQILEAHIIQNANR